MTLLLESPSVSLKTLLQSPRLRLYANEIDDLLAEEDKKRKQFYEKINEDDKAEFINGEIVMHSPVKLWHGVVCNHLFGLLMPYVAKHALGYVGYEKITVSLTRNDYQPDVWYFRKEVADQFAPNQMLFPAPDLVVEVSSPSTKHRDRGVKFDDYAAHGVMEYWMIEPEDQIVEQYLLDGDVYQLQFKASNGVVNSMAVEGFNIPVAALFDQNVYFETLQTLIS